MDNDTAISSVQLSEEEIKVLADFFSVLIEIEKQLKTVTYEDECISN
jgi:hypothetical protein